jgi:hypothetical protein
MAIWIGAHKLGQEDYRPTWKNPSQAPPVYSVPLLPPPVTAADLEMFRRAGWRIRPTRAR